MTFSKRVSQNNESPLENDRYTMIVVRARMWRYPGAACERERLLDEVNSKL